MENSSIVPQIDRLAKVNELILVEGNLDCLDYKYVNIIAAMKERSWFADVAQTGSSYFSLCDRPHLHTILFSTTMDLSNMH